MIIYTRPKIFRGMVIHICDVVQMCFKSSLMLLVLSEAVKKKMLVMVFPTKPSEFVKLRAVTFDGKRGYQIAQY